MLFLHSSKKGMMITKKIKMKYAEKTKKTAKRAVHQGETPMQKNNPKQPKTTETTQNNMIMIMIMIMIMNMIMNMIMIMKKIL